MKPSLVLATALLGLTACQPGDRGSTTTSVNADGTRSAIRTAGAWCRPSPAGAQTGACYLTLESSAGDRLTGVATPASTATQIHDMTTEDGMMQMGEMAGGLPLPAGETVSLAPGGRHLMLVGLTAPLVVGEQVPLTLGFEKSPALTVQAEVRQPVPAPTDTPAAPATASAKKTH